MALLKRYLRLELGTLLQNNIRFRVIGRVQDLSPDIQQELADAEARTAANTGLLFNIALNYSGRAEITDAVRRMIAAGVPSHDVTEQRVSDFLYTAGQPDPDLLIRTSGEMRVSNFLLWQIAYAEIWVTDTFWPDFRARHLLDGILGVPETRSAVWRPEAVASRHPPVTRLLSALALLVVIGGAAWLAPPEGLLALAIAIASLAFIELARLGDALGARVPRAPGLFLTALVCHVRRLARH